MKTLNNFTSNNAEKFIITITMINNCTSQLIKHIKTTIKCMFSEIRECG